MADRGVYIGNFEYGRCPYAGVWTGNFEYGRCPGIGFTHYPELTVKSSPESGIEIQVSPADIYGQSTGTTEFVRHYELGANVSLTAPASFGNYTFEKWVVQGDEYQNRQVSVYMEFDKVATAYYILAVKPEITRGVELLATKLLKKRFWIADYPNLEPSLEGVAMPIAWGAIEGAPLFCIDTQEGRYKIVDTQGRPIKAVNKVYDKEVELVEGVDFEVDLDNAEIVIFKPPLLEANRTYYFYIESDYPINGSDYYRFAQIPISYLDPYCRYDIDNDGVWTPVYWTLAVIIYGRTSIDAQDEVLFDSWSGSWEGWNRECKLRASISNVRIGMKFTTPSSGGPWFLSKIALSDVVRDGSPPSSAITRLVILSSISPETQVGGKSFRMEDYTEIPGDAFFLFPQRSDVSDIRCDFESVKDNSGNLIENVADILKDCYVNVLGGSEAGLDSSSLAALKTARPEALAVYIKDEIVFQQFLERLEAGQMFKFMPDASFRFTTLIASASSPTVAVFYDDEITELKTHRVWRSVYQKVKIKYAENPTTNEWSIVEKEAPEVTFLYRIQRVLEIETYFKNQTDAETYASKYLDSMREPLYIVSFRTASPKSFNLLPWQKIELYYPRVDYSGNAFSGTAFRVLSVKTNPLTGESEVRAVLDSQTW